MATTYFLAGKDDVSVNANWSGGAVPSSGDTIIFNDGGATITAGWASLSAVNPARVLVTNGFKGSLGSASTQATFGTITLLEIDGAGGTFNIAATTTEAKINNAAGGKVLFTSGTHTDVACFAGEVEFSGSAVLTTLRNVGARVVVRYNATGITKLTHRDGYTEWWRAVTTAFLLGGTSRGEQGAVTTMYIDGAAHNHKQDTITKLEVFKGRFSVANAKALIIVTNADLYAGATIDDTGKVNYLTWTNKPKPYGFNGGSAFQ